MENKLKIVIVEDEAIIASDIKANAESFGYEVAGIASDGRKAIELCRLYKPDFVLMDIVIKGDFDGIETAMRLKKDLSIPVIYITAYGDDAMLERAKVTEPLGYILKPFDNRQLKAILAMASYGIEADKKFKRAEVKYFRLTENSSDMIYRMKIPEGSYEFVNTACESITGYSREEFYSTPKLYKKYVHPSWMRYLEAEWEKLLAGEFTPYQEFQIITKSGSSKWLCKRNVLIKNQTGSVIAVECIATDITEQKNIESLLRFHEEEYRAVFDLMPLMILIKDENNKIIRTNLQTAKYKGKKIDEIEGCNLEEIFPEYAGKYFEADREIIITGKPRLGIVDEFEDSTGNKKLMKADTYPFRTDESESVYIILMVHEIAYSGELLKPLETNESRYRKLMQNAPVAITRILIKDEKYEMVNDEFTSQSGYTMDEFNALSEEELKQIIHPEDRKYVFGKFSGWAKEGYPGVLHMTYRFVNKSNEIKWLDCYSYVDNDERGFPEAVNQIYIDVTELKKTEEALSVSENTFKALADTAQAVFFIAQGESFIYGNKYTEGFLGYTLVELYSMKFWDIIHDDFKEIVKDRAIKRMKGEDVPSRYEMKVVTKSGGSRWIDYSGSQIVFNEQPAIIGIAFDITEKKEAERKQKENEDKFKRLANNSPFSYLRLNLKTNQYDFSNEEFIRLTGYSMDDFNKLSDEEKLKTVHEQDRAKLSSGYKVWQSNGMQGMFKNEYRMYHKDGTERWVESYVYADISEEGKPEFLNEMVIDVTDRKFANLAIEQSEKKYRKLAENLPVGMTRFDLSEKKVDFVNDEFIKLSGYSLEEYSIFNLETIYSLVHPEDIHKLDKIQKEWSETGMEGVYRIDYRIRNKSGVYMWVDTFLFAEPDAEGKPRYLNQICVDISERKKSELALFNSEERYRTFIEQSSEGIFRAELINPIPVTLPADEQVTLMFRDFYYAECNDIMAQMYGFKNSKEFTGKKVGDMLLPTDPDSLNFMKNFVLSNYRITDSISKEVDINGNNIFISNNVVGTVKNGMLVRVWGTQRDITEHKRQEDALKQSIREKEVLIKEVHHRVKNNLQIVTSLLKLQASQIKDAKVANIFEESKNRIHSMSLIHEKLYQARDFTNVDFNEYAGMLVSNLLASYGMSESTVKVVLNTNSIMMSIDNAIPTGLIINELVTNSLKHGFHDISEKELRIRLDYNPDEDVFSLLVKDNGVGLPENFDIESSSSFGLKLVSTLTEQMSGEIKYDGVNGAEFFIQFKSSDYKKRE